MIRAVLGDSIDIHGGGMDLIFPHHENEITDDELAALDEELKGVVQDAWDFADQSPEPPPEALWEDVYVDTTSDAVNAETAVAAD